MQIRSARIEESAVILDLVKELAEYERASHEVTATVDDLRATLFGDDARAFCEVVEVDKKVIGIAIWFLNYSTWQGKHGIYLEDLFVKPEYRGRGYGKALLQHLAAICNEKGYGRFQWAVLDWNSPAIEFYRSLGAEAMTDWITHRVTGPNLEKLGQIKK